MLSAEAYISGELRDIPEGGGFGDQQHTLCLRTYFSCCCCLPVAGGQDAAQGQDAQGP